MPGKDVLLVDNNANIRILAQMALEEVAGWNVLVAESGQQALKTLAEVRPHLILLDMMMPQMDGKMTLSRIKSDGYSDIPVIFMTAKVQASELDQYEELGVAGVITKPFDPMKLATLIEDLLAKQ